MNADEIDEALAAASAPAAESEVILPPHGHVCNLPTGDHHAGMTLARCRACGAWWFWDWSPGGDIAGWPYREWRQVRWYHFRLRRRIDRSPAQATLGGDA